MSKSWESQPINDDSEANTPFRPGASSKSQLTDDVNRLYPLFQVPPGVSPSLSEPESARTQRIEALKDLSRLIDLVVIEQENKYGRRLSPHSNIYRRHIMVQQFLRISAKISTSLNSEGIIFDWDMLPAGILYNANGRRLKKKKKIIPERKGRDDYFSFGNSG